MSEIEKLGEFLAEMNKSLGYLAECSEKAIKDPPSESRERLLHNIFAAQEKILVASRSACDRLRELLG